jgi:hypothetical protein
MAVRSGTALARALAGPPARRGLGGCWQVRAGLKAGTQIWPAKASVTGCCGSDSASPGAAGNVVDTSRSFSSSHDSGQDLANDHL